MKSFILVIEHDQDLGYSISELFQPEGFSVVQAMDSSDGVSRLMEVSPEIVMMSEDMPPLDGVELLPLVRRLTASPIIVVGAGGETAVVKALLQGADVYMSHPVNYRELLSRVRSLLRNSHYRRNSHNDDNGNSSNNLKLSEPITRLPSIFYAREAGSEEGLLNFMSRRVARTLRAVFRPMPAT